MSFIFLTFEELVKELEKYKFSQFHIHHTWKPAHSSFKGNNHMSMQQAMKDYHTKINKWVDIGQHLTLFPDGRWLSGRPLYKTPASISGWNSGALAVEMVGNFDIPGTGVENDLGYDKLEGEQKQEILKLMKYFIDKYGEQSIKFHRDSPTAGKTCPGTSLNKYSMINEAKELNKVTEKKEHVVSDWAKDAWDWAVAEKITDGTNPKLEITREQVVTMLYRYSKLKEGK